MVAAPVSHNPPTSTPTPHVRLSLLTRHIRGGACVPVALEFYQRQHRSDPSVRPLVLERGGWGGGVSLTHKRKKKENGRELTEEVPGNHLVTLYMDIPQKCQMSSPAPFLVFFLSFKQNSAMQNISICAFMQRPCNRMTWIKTPAVDFFFFLLTSDPSSRQSVCGKAFSTRSTAWKGRRKCGLNLNGFALLNWLALRIAGTDVRFLDTGTEFRLQVKC